MTDFRSNAFVDVDFSALEKRVAASDIYADLFSRQGLTYGVTVTGRFPTKPAPVDLPPRHPATNIGE